MNYMLTIIYLIMRVQGKLHEEYPEVNARAQIRRRRGEVQGCKVCLFLLLHALIHYNGNLYKATYKLSVTDYTYFRA